jgi:alkylation response protein AidB-like acyl-CoA dehydrogenase
MDFELSEDTKLLVDSFKQWVARELIPLEEKHGITQDVAIPNEVAKYVRTTSAELGFYNHHMPAEVGGGGLSMIDSIVLREACGQTGSVLASVAIAGPEGPSPMHMVFDEAQRAKYLAPVMRGEQSACFMLTEPGAGSDAANIETFAEKRGDSWVINGNKHFITNGRHADWGVVFAVTDKQKRARGGISAFIVERGQFALGQPNYGMSGFEGLSEIVFEDVVVPDSQRVGKEGYGFAQAMSFLGVGRLFIAAASVGVAQYLLDLGVAYAKERKTFGQPIASYQGIQWMLADSATEIYAARMMVYHAAWLIDQGRDATREMSMCKLYATEMVNRVCDRVLQIHGGAGWMKDCKTEAFYRSLRVLRIVEGTSEIQRMVIARSVIG